MAKVYVVRKGRVATSLEELEEGMVAAPDAQPQGSGEATQSNVDGQSAAASNMGEPSEAQDVTSNPDTDKKEDKVSTIDEVVELQAEVAEEVEDIEEDIKEAEDTKETLEKVEAVATEALEEDNATPQLGEATHILLSDLFGRAGIHDDALLPTVEMFKNPKTTRAALQIAVESIGVARGRIDKSVSTARGLVVLKKNSVGVSTEGFLGGLTGFFAGFFGSWVAGVAYKSSVARTEKEIENISKEIRKVAMDSGRQAVKEGKLSAEDFEKHIDVPAETIVAGAFLGLFFGPFYGAIKGSELENLRKELDQKKKELNNLLIASVGELKKSEASSVSNEGFMAGVAGYTGHNLVNIALFFSLPFRFLAPVFIGINAGVGGTLASQVQKKRIEIENLSREIMKISLDAGKQAVSEGKLSAKDYRKNVSSVSVSDVIYGALLGTLFGPVYTAIKTSQLDNAVRGLKAKEKELQALLDTVASRGQN